MSDKTQLSTEYSQDKKNSKKKILALILVLAIVVASATIGIGYTVAKYASSLGDDYHYIDARDFFFTSDYLKEGNDIPTYTIYNFKNNHSISFNVYNYADELSVTPDAITFSANSSAGTLSVPNNTLGGGSKNSQQITLSVTSIGTYTVSVAASSPYTKTLSANFTFVEYAAPGIEYDIVNYNDYVVLNIGVGAHKDATCNVNIAWDSNKFIMDTTNTLFNSVNTNVKYKTANVIMNTGGSYQVILYKKVLNSPAPTKANSAAETADANKVYVGFTA